MIFPNNSVTRLLAALFLLAAGTTAWPGSAVFDSTQAAFERGLAGDEAANVQAHAGFTELSHEHPDNPLYLAYRGASETILARDGWLPWKRIAYLERGLGHIDKALAMLGPEHDRQYERGSVIGIETRLVALTTFLQVPAFANRLQDARDLLAETLARPALAQAPAEVRQRIYLQGADLAARDGDTAAERRYLRQALAAWPGSPRASGIARRLETEVQP